MTEMYKLLGNGTEEPNESFVKFIKHYYERLGKEGPDEKDKIMRLENILNTRSQPYTIKFVARILELFINNINSPICIKNKVNEGVYAKIASEEYLDKLMQPSEIHDEKDK